MNPAIKRVHVVFKTHLDVGFTNLACYIHQQYIHHHIPVSLGVARSMNTPDHKKFIWTMGSYMIDYALRYGTEEEKQQLIQAIERGDIVWHGLAMTTHTELLDETLLDYDLSVSEDLDRRFGRHTISSKMTDVPGHPQAMIRHLARHGIEYLHIGVNGSSMVPAVPGTFVWKCGDESIIVQYSALYGDACYVEGQEDVLEFAHTGDNQGPQSAEDVEKELDRIQAKYPGAEVFASTMDDYARTLLPIKDTLPVVDAEIGDTWDYGVAADPVKTAAYRELCRLKDEWLAAGKLKASDPFYHDFMMDLLLVPEHTHGMDIKRYLFDYTHYDKDDFQKARKADKVDVDYLPGELAIFNGSDEQKIARTSSYSRFESSHEEQRVYLRAAISVLPEDLKQEAVCRVRALSGDAIYGPQDEGKVIASDEWLKVSSFPVPRKASLPAMENQGQEVLTDTDVTLGQFVLRVAPDGSLSYLCSRSDGHVWVSAPDGSVFGRLGYCTYSADDCDRTYRFYNRDMLRTWVWSRGDMNKPGLLFARTAKTASYSFTVEKITLRKTTEEDALLITLRGVPQACETYGCPRRAQIRYAVSSSDPSSLKIRLMWFDKDANRMPEALWLDVNPAVQNAPFYRYITLGQAFDPMHVVYQGNRRQHVVQSLRYQAPDGRFELVSRHAPVLSVGGRFLFDDYRPEPDLSRGFSFCLYNNRWGTNFKMWCEDDAAFEFEWRF